MPVFLCIDIFFLHDSMCTDSFFLAVAPFNTQWRHDVSLKITTGIKPKNIIRTGLNGFTAEQLLYRREISISLSFDGGWGE